MSHPAPPSFFRFLRALTLASISLLPAIAHAQKYQVTVLSTPPGLPYAEANAINNAGQVVGETFAPTNGLNATIWNGTEPTVLLEGGRYGAFAYDINDSGVVVGILYGASASQPFAWSGNHVHFLPVAAADFSNLAFGINEAGEIVGSTTDGATLWESPLATRYTLLPEFESSIAWGISPLGVIVGDTAVAAPARPLRWKSAAVAPALLGNSKAGIARRVNAQGWAVGSVSTGSYLDHAAVWGPHTDAYPLPDLSNSSEAFGLNAQGDVVGQALDSSDLQHAVLWTHKHFTLVDLNTELGESGRTIYLTDARGINDHCVIVANGYDRTSHVQEVYLLTPTDPSTCDPP